jgi:hypothetical protein
VLASKLGGGASLVTGRLSIALVAVLMMIWLHFYRRQFDGAQQAASRLIAPHSGSTEDISVVSS